MRGWVGDTLEGGGSGKGINAQSSPLLTGGAALGCCARSPVSLLLLCCLCCVFCSFLCLFSCRCGVVGSLGVEVGEGANAHPHT